MTHHGKLILAGFTNTAAFGAANVHKGIVVAAVARNTSIGIAKLVLVFVKTI